MKASSGKRIVLAYSGGLDTSFCLVWLLEQGYQVETVTVDTGGIAREQLTALAARALELGSHRHQTLDARNELYWSYLRYLLFANARRGAAYPLCVSAERVCQARSAAEYALERQADGIAHGSTGAGNDQVRFDCVFNVVAPQLELLAPVRSLGLSRQAEADYLRERGYEVDSRTERYSVNSGMWGATVGGAETHGSELPLPDEAWPGSDQPVPQDSLLLRIGFRQGIPVSLDGKPLEPVTLIEQLGGIGSQYQIGRGIHLGDTIFGIKGRVGYSGPAAELLIAAHRELEKLTLSAKQQFWKETLGNLYGSLLHEAQFLDPLCRDLEALLESSQLCVTGEVSVSLQAGRFSINGCSSPHSLLALQPAAYGEQHKGWTAQEAAAFNLIYAQQQRLCWQQRQAAKQQSGSGVLA